MVNKYSVARTTEEEAGEVVGIWEVLGRRWSLLILKESLHQRSNTFQ